MSNLIPEGWSFEAIGNFIADSVAGEWGTEPKGDENDIPVLRATNFSLSGAIDYKKLAIRNIEEKKRLRKSLVKGDVVIEKSGGSPTQPVGRVIYFENNIPFLYSNFTQKLSPIKNVNSKFMFYKLYFEYLNGVVLKFQQQTTGIINLQLAEYLLYKSLFPPLPEQQKIAAILTSVDEVIEKTQAQIDKLKDLKSGMMQELLTKGVGIKQGGKYVPHIEFKDSPVGKIPKSWEVLDLDDVASVVDSMHQTPTFSDVGMPMVRVTEIRQNDILDISGAMLVNAKTFNAFSKNYKPNVGDILIARVGAYFGATAYISLEHEFCLGQNTASIRPNTILSQFLFICLNSENVRSQMNDAVAVGAQPSLSLKAIKELKIVIPSHQEQKVISGSINSVSKRVSMAQKKLQQLKNTKKALMQDLLTGKVRVKVDNDSVV